MTQIRQAIEVNVPVYTAYNQWTQFENFPKFMHGVQEVRQLDDAHLHWRAMRHGQQIEWDSEITEQVPDQLIAWRDMDGPGNQGSIHFQPLQNESSRIEVVMDVSETQSDASQAGSGLEQRLGEDLNRFKQMIESQNKETGAWRGEIHQGQTTRSHAESGQSKSGHQPWLPNLLQAWEEPVGMMRKMSDEMDQLFERVLGRPMSFRFGQVGMANKWMPQVDVYQQDNQLVVCAALPGVKKEDVKVEIRQDKLIIEGTRNEFTQQSAQGYQRGELHSGAFYRMIALPEGVDDQQATASMKDGLLEIKLNFQQQSQQKSKHIEIS